VRLNERVWIPNFFYVVHLLRFQNTLLIINFKILKYIKIIFKILKQCVFNAQTSQKNLG